MSHTCVIQLVRFVNIMQDLFVAHSSEEDIRELQETQKHEFWEYIFSFGNAINDSNIL